MKEHMASKSTLASAGYDVADAFEANELFQRNGWTDGLPIVPPTEAGVLRFLEAVHLAADDVVGIEPVRRRRITAEKVAIAAVMAGCLPEYMPVVVAIIKAMCEPEFGLHGSTASTGGSAPFIVVNGPIRTSLAMNATHNAFANASRANATIGRSVRLFIINVLGGIPGQLDRSTLGHPGKFTFCIAEDEEGSPWTPLSVGARRARRIIRDHRDGGGVPAPDHERMDAGSEGNPRYLRGRHPRRICSPIRSGRGTTRWLSPCNTARFSPPPGGPNAISASTSHETARVTRREWRSVGKAAVAGRKDEDRAYCALRSPDDLLVVAAGGPAGGFGAVVPPWYGKKSLAVTTQIGA